MRPYILAETNWKNIKIEKFDVAILPWGATEAHNFHLPYGTDVIEADHVAAEAAKVAWESGAKVIVLPTIPFGVNTGQADITLDINLNPSTQMAILSDVITVLNRQQIHKLVILNSHGGNDFKQIIRELGLKFPDMLICTCNWYKIPEIHSIFDEPGDHAGEMETSLLMHLMPELVLPLEQAGDGKAKKFRVSALNQGWAWAEREWSKVTADTGVGNPAAASPEKGAQCFKILASQVGQFFIELAQTDQKNLYE
ncbi:MAG: creatininase family protein [Candidatus Cyclobacteriaceae bacterium M3_2C_046]